MANASGTYTTLDVPMRIAGVFLARALSGLDNRTQLHVTWQAPFDNGVDTLWYELMADGTKVIVPADHSLQYILGGLHPGTSHHFFVRAVNSLGPGPPCPTS
eukprot:1706258-Prymnesium_polylepis.1